MGSCLQVLAFTFCFDDELHELYPVRRDNPFRPEIAFSPGVYHNNRKYTLKMTHNPVPLT